MVVMSLKGDVIESCNLHITSKIYKEYTTLISITDLSFCKSPYPLVADM